MLQDVANLKLQENHEWTRIYTNGETSGAEEIPRSNIQRQNNTRNRPHRVSPDKSQTPIFYRRSQRGRRGITVQSLKSKVRSREGGLTGGHGGSREKAEDGKGILQKITKGTKAGGGKPVFTGAPGMGPQSTVQSPKSTVQSPKSAVEGRFTAAGKGGRVNLLSAR
jgi:hypothetical protein